MKRTKTIRLILWLAALLCMLSACQKADADARVSALFINVGKADAALICLDERAYLVDTGRKSSAEQILRVLDAYDISRLDGIIVTHTDKDHAGGLKKLLKSGLTVERLYAGALHSEASMEEHPVYKASEAYSVPLTWLEVGDEIEAGGSTFRVLGPLSRDDENENNNSLVLRLCTPEGDVLLTGDMEREEETELLEAGLLAPAEVLKVAHHGKGDATGKRFALVVRPQWAIISTSGEEEPDTPDGEVLFNLSLAQCSVAVTQEAEVGILITLSEGQAEAQRIDWAETR